MIFNNVDLPEPFRPNRATRSPELMVSEALENKTRSAYCFEILLNWSITAIFTDKWLQIQEARRDID